MFYKTPNPHGGDVYTGKIRLDFSANTNPLGTPPKVLEAIRAVLPELHQYPDPYCRTLVRAIAEFEDLPAEYILCGNGAAELIHAYCRALRPTRAAELAPTFSEYGQALTENGCQVLRYSLHLENNFDPGPDLLDFLQRERPETVFLCSPNNPTGRVIPLPFLDRVLDCCRAIGARLFLDECFLDLTDGLPSMKKRLADCPELFILKAFTKSYGMAGIRLGYGLCSDPELLGRMAAVCPPWNVSTLAQAAGVAALQEQDFLDRARHVIRTERPRVQEALGQMGFYVCPSSANYLLFSGLEELHIRLRRQGIALRSCENLPGLGRGWYRTAIRRPEQNDTLLTALRQASGEV